MMHSTPGNPGDSRPRNEEDLDENQNHPEDMKRATQFIVPARFPAT